MYILICEPSAQQLEIMYTDVMYALTTRNQEALVFCFSKEEEMEAYLSVSPDPPDVIFLSLQTKQIHVLCASLAARYPRLGLVLTGMPPSDIEELFAMGVLYFLYKPLRAGSMDRFAAFLIENMQQKTERHLILKEKQHHIAIPYSKILYISSDKRKICVCQPNGVCSETYRKLDEVEEELDARFVRCHQSFLVNMDYIRGITDECFQLIGDTFIPISQKRFWGAKKQYIEYVKCKG